MDQALVGVFGIELLRLPRFMVKNYCISSRKHLQHRVEIFIRNFEIPIEK